MQYVRSLSGSVSKTWNSINPATLSGAIDVIVVEQEDGSLACSPFHVRFGKFSLLRPSEKKVEFKVNGERRDFPMKLGEGGEAFFVFETSSSVPEALQTSPLVSPATSPQVQPSPTSNLALSEPPAFELEPQSDADTAPTVSPTGQHSQSAAGLPAAFDDRRAQSDFGASHLQSSPLGSLLYTLTLLSQVMPPLCQALQKKTTAPLLCLKAGPLPVKSSPPAWNELRPTMPCLQPEPQWNSRHSQARSFRQSILILLH